MIEETEITPHPEATPIPACSAVGPVHHVKHGPDIAYYCAAPMREHHSGLWRCSVGHWWSLALDDDGDPHFTRASAPHTPRHHDTGWVAAPRAAHHHDQASRHSRADDVGSAGMNPPTHLWRPGILVGRRVLVTTCTQGGGAPWVDQAVTTDADGAWYRSIAVKPSLRPRAARKMGGALVIGWRLAP